MIVPRADLFAIRADYQTNSKTRSGRGRRPLGDVEATTDGLVLAVDVDGAQAKGWNAPLDAYLDRWPEELSVVEGGPGSVGMSGAPGATDVSAGAPAPSGRPGK